jgi:hypothetical protein
MSEDLYKHISEAREAINASRSHALIAFALGLVALGLNALALVLKILAGPFGWESGWF